MSDLRKRARVVNNGVDDDDEANSDSFSDESGEDMDDQFVDEVVMVDFEGRDVEGGDFEGIKTMLKQLFLKAHVDVSSIADIIIQQKHIGSVLKQSENPEDSLEDDDDDDDDDSDVIFGLTTVVNLTHNQNVQSVEQITSLLLEKSKATKNQNVRDLMSNILSKKKDAAYHTGFIISERFVNVPPEIAPPLLENLSKEIKEAQGSNEPFAFDHFIMICKIYKLITQNGKKETSSTVYSKPEDEIWHKESLISFDYSIASDSDSALEGDWNTDDDGMKPFHLVLVISADNFDNIVSQIRSAFTKC